MLTEGAQSVNFEHPQSTSRPKYPALPDRNSMNNPSILLKCIITSSSQHASKIRPLRRSLQKSKNQFQHFVYLLDAHYNLLIFWKFTSNWWRWTKIWVGTALVNKDLGWNSSYSTGTFKQYFCDQLNTYTGEICTFFCNDHSCLPKLLNLGNHK